MDFVAIDFETANSMRSSVCSIGIVKVSGGKIQEELHTLINPLSEFHYYNTKIHGITEEMVINAPTFEEFWPHFKPMIENQTIIAHNASFDIGVLRESVRRCHEEVPHFVYSCSYQIAKKVWPNLYNHKLSTVANYLNINLRHHDALEDARASAKIILEAGKKTKTITVDELVMLNKLKVKVATEMPKKTNRPKSQFTDSHLYAHVQPSPISKSNHPFNGMNIVFTGEMISMTRIQAAQYAVDFGAQCKVAVDGHTNFLVVGDRALENYIQGIKSAKMQRAEQMILQGHRIEIVGEQDFIKLIKM